MTHQPHGPAAGGPAVVTIYESYGAGASQVGHAVAIALRLPFHRQAFSSEAIEGGHDTVRAEEAHFLERMIAVIAARFGPESADPDPTVERYRAELIAENKRQLAEAAARGGVIVGRNGARLLADRPRTLHVLLTGSAEDRLQRAMSQAHISREHAQRRQEREDQIRADMAVALYDWDPRALEHYDLVVNTRRVPLEAVVDVILASVRAMPG